MTGLDMWWNITFLFVGLIAGIAIYSLGWQRGFDAGIEHAIMLTKKHEPKDHS